MHLIISILLKGQVMGNKSVESLIYIRIDLGRQI